MAFHSSYDTDVTTFSPAGRLHQVEYAMEAVKQGNALVGLKNGNYAVLAALRKRQSKLAYFQNKLFAVDDHIVIGVSGLTADARAIAQKLLKKCAEHHKAFGTRGPVERALAIVANKAQLFTQKSDKRPYGVGVLAVGVDSLGPHLFEISPAGTLSAYRAQAIGAKSQGARTVLEAELASGSIEAADKDEMVRLALKALRGASGDEALGGGNCRVAVVQRDGAVEFLEGEALSGFMPLVCEKNNGGE